MNQVLDDLLTTNVLGIKNTQSQAILQVAVKTAQAILANVSQLLPAGSF